MMPPRTAKSPRRSTRSTLEYARKVSSRNNSSNMNSFPISKFRSGIVVMEETMGCTKARAVVTITFALSKWSSVFMRLATVSLLGLNRS